MRDAKIAVDGLRRAGTAVTGPIGIPGELIGAAIVGGPPKPPETGGPLTCGTLGS
jgi:hypothetical protein